MGIKTLLKGSESVKRYIESVCNLEADAWLLRFLGLRGAGGGAVQRTAAASSRTELAAFPEHLPLALGALWDHEQDIPH